MTEVSVDYYGRVNQHIKSPVQNKDNDGPVGMEQVIHTLLNRDLHKIIDWEEVLPTFSASDRELDIDASPGKTMNQLFGVGNYEPSAYLR